VDFVVSLDGYDWPTYIRSALFVDSVVRFCFAQSLHGDATRASVVGARGTQARVQLALSVLAATSTTTSDSSARGAAGAEALQAAVSACFADAQCRSAVAVCLANQGMPGTTWTNLTRAFG